MTDPDDHAPPPPTDSSTNPAPEVPPAPAMQVDSSLIVDVVRGSGAPSEHTAVAPNEHRAVVPNENKRQ